MPIYSSFMMPMRGEWSKRAFVSCALKGHYILIASLGSSAISTAGLTDGKAVWGALLCSWNCVCREWSSQKANGPALAALLPANTSYLSCIPARAWHTRQSASVTCGVNAQQWLLLVPQQRHRHRVCPLGSHGICAGTAGAKGVELQVPARERPLCSLWGAAADTLGAVGLAVFSSSPIHSQRLHCRFMLS